MSQDWPPLKDPGSHSVVLHPLNEMIDSHTVEKATPEISQAAKDLGTGNVPEGLHHSVEAVNQIADTTIEAMKKTHDQVASELSADQESVKKNNEEIEKRQLEIDKGQTEVQREREKVISEREQIERDQSKLAGESQNGVIATRKGSTNS